MTQNIISVPLKQIYKSKLPPAYQTQGTLWLKTDTNELYIFDGRQWRFLVKIPNEVESSFYWRTIDW